MLRRRRRHLLGCEVWGYIVGFEVHRFHATAHAHARAGRVPRARRRITLETYAVRGGQDDPSVLVHERGDLYARDDAVYWGFSRSSRDRQGRLAGLRGFELVDAPEIAGHPRIIGTLEKG
jgi:hypothetical protein